MSVLPACQPALLRRGLPNCALALMTASRGSVEALRHQRHDPVDAERAQNVQMGRVFTSTSGAIPRNASAPPRVVPHATLPSTYGFCKAES